MNENESFGWDQFRDSEVDVTEDDLLSLNSVQIFTQDTIRATKKYCAGLEGEQFKRVEPLVLSMARNNGYRRLPDLENGLQRLFELRDQFDNLSDVIDRLAGDLTIACAMAPENFHVNPVLIVGQPGIGKTMLAQGLAKAINTTMFKISAGTAQAAFQLCGSAAQWGNSQPGSIVRVLADGDCAAPIMIIDEVDKMVNDDRFSTTPILLDILEPTTAQVFSDEFLQARFDASRLITILTANNIDRVPGPLLSRVEVLEVPAPAPPQRLRIIENEMTTLCAKTNTQITLSKSDAVQLAERTDLDLRKTTRIVRDSFAVALSEKSEVAVLRIPRSTKRTMGFM